MIGPILGAATGIIGMLSQQQAQEDALAFQQENLDFQKANADRQFNLATAERTDAYGNVTGYDPVMNEWELSLTPEQQAITDAFQMEQHKGLTEDATRARDLRRMQEERSKAAEPLYNEAVAEYMYSPYQPGEEGEYVSDAMESSAIARREANNQRAMTSRTNAIRAGQGGDLEQIMKTADTVTADNMVKDILASKEAGRTSHANAMTNWEGIMRPRIDMFASMMDDISQAGTVNPDTPQRMDATQRDMLDAIGAAMTNESTQVGNAYGNLASTAGQGGLDLSGIASSLAQIGSGGSSTPSFSATQVTPWYQPESQDERLQGGFTTRYV